MKKIKYLLILVLATFCITDVKASVLASDFKLPEYFWFNNCNSNDSCGTYYPGRFVSSDLISYYRTDKEIQTISNSSGAGVVFSVAEGFVKDNYYTISILLSPFVRPGESSNYSYYVPYTTNNLKVGVSDTYTKAIYAKADLESYNTGGMTDILFCESGTACESISFNGSVLTYTFKANYSGSYVFLTFTSAITMTASPEFYGYIYSVHGTKAPTADEIASSLNNQFTIINSNLSNIENNINNNINNIEQSIKDSVDSSTNMITSSIDTMKNSIDDSINSESSDTTSSSCGIICKLKGIFTGIINLPQNIWNFLKVGFDAITSVVGDLINSITSIFTPDSGECILSENLFDYTISPYSGSRTIIENGVSTSYEVSYQLEFLKNKGKTYTISFDFNGGSTDITMFSYCYRVSSYISCTRQNVSIVDNHYVANFTIPDENIVYAYIRFMSYASVTGTTNEFTNIMLVEGSTAKEYTPFGQEVCPEKQTFLGWLGSFFTNIVTGILELPVKLVSLLLDGLKSLFVPTEDQLLDIVDKSSSLAENFGFVGESVNFFLNIFTSLLGLVSQNGCIIMPEFSLGKTSLFDAHTFWEKQQVCLADNDILSHNIDMIRTITSIVIVSMFVNFASRKFFSILSKNDDNQQLNEEVDN